jgi:hypothetical protein
MCFNCDSKRLTLFIKNHPLKACLLIPKRALSASQTIMLKTWLAQPRFDKYTMKFVCQTNLNDPFVEAGWSRVIGLDRLVGCSNSRYQSDRPLHSCLHVDIKVSFSLITTTSLNKKAQRVCSIHSTMHATTLFLASLGTASTAFAAPNEYSTSSSTNGICTDYSVTADFTSTNLKWVYPQFESNLDIAAFIANATAKDSATTYRPLVGNETVTKKHTIAATFCTPKITKDGKEKTVLLASHGAAYDGRYVTLLASCKVINHLQC